MTMTRRMVHATAAILLAFAGAGGVRAAEPDLSGEWTFEVASPNGPGHRDVLFRQEGRRVIGFIESNSASGRFVGTFDGTHLAFTAVLEFGGSPMAAVYEAQVEGNNMRGSIDFGDYGKATFVGHRGRAVPAADAAPAGIEGSAATAGITAAAVGDFFGISRGGVLLPEMLAVAGGRFRMGDGDAHIGREFNADYARVHTVEVSDFLLSRFLITNAQYSAFCEATGRECPLPPKGWGDYLRRMPNHPVVNVNLHDAQAYTDWLAKITGQRYRLPTEAEWEYAARAGASDHRTFTWGDGWDASKANTSIWHIGKPVDRDGWKTWWDSTGEALARSQAMTTRVGSFPPNARGFYDMIGNVWEWTGDWYQADYYDVSPARNPAGPPTGQEKVLRGCSWYNKPEVCLIATRDRYNPEARLYYNGFRVAAPGAAEPR